VKDSRLDVSGTFEVGSGTGFLITGTSIVNADVDGAASLNGTLKDSILTVNSLELTGDSALQNTELTIDDYDFDVAKNLTIDKDSALIVSGGSITNSANITVTVSADSSCTDAVITVADAFTAAEDANKLSVNVQNLSSDLGVYMVVDADAQSLYNAEITGNGENNYRLKTIGNDLYVTNVSLDVLAVNNAWSSKKIGEEVTATVNGAEMTFFYGVNAFSTIKAAAEVLNSVTEQTADPEKVSKIAVTGSAAAYGENVTITNDVTLTTTSDSAEKVKLNSYTITVTAGTATFDANADFSNTGDNVKVSGADAEVLMKAGSKVDKLTVADNASASVGEAEADAQAELTGFVNEGGTLTINNAAVGASSAAGGETNVSGSTFNGDISITGGTFTDNNSTFNDSITVTENGSMSLTGSEILTDSTITGKSITNSGKLSLKDVEVGYDGTDLSITNSGTLELDGNNTVIAKTISGDMDVKGGTLTFAKSGTYQDGKLTVDAGATLNLEKGFVIGNGDSSTAEFALGGTVKLNAMNQIIVNSDGTWNDANAAVKIGTDGYDSSVNGAVKVIDRTGGAAYVMNNYEVSGSAYGLVEYNYDLWITDADKTDKKVIYVNAGGSGAGDQEYGYIFGYNAVKGVSDLSNVYSAAGDDTEKFLFNGGTYQIGTASESIRSYDLALYGNASVTFSGTYEG